MTASSYTVSGVCSENSKEALRQEISRISGITSTEIDGANTLYCHTEPGMSKSQRAIVEARVRKTILDAGFRLDNI